MAPSPRARPRCDRLRCAGHIRGGRGAIFGGGRGAILGVSGLDAFARGAPAHGPFNKTTPKSTPTQVHARPRYPSPVGPQGRCNDPQVSTPLRLAAMRALIWHATHPEIWHATRSHMAGAREDQLAGLRGAQGATRLARDAPAAAEQVRGAGIS
eukprot:7244877-Prymnesium_polylepis.1